MSQLLQKDEKISKDYFLFTPQPTTADWSIHMLSGKYYLKEFSHLKESKDETWYQMHLKTLAIDIIMNMWFLFQFCLEVLNFMIWVISLLQKQKVLIDFLIG